MRFQTRYFLIPALMAVVCSPVLAQDVDVAPGSESEEAPSSPSSSERPRFGGPDQVDNQIANDRAATSRTIRERLLDPYFAWKEALQEERGLAFSVDYSAVYLNASQSPGDPRRESGSSQPRFADAGWRR